MCIFWVYIGFKSLYQLAKSLLLVTLMLFLFPVEDDSHEFLLR